MTATNAHLDIPDEYFSPDVQSRFWSKVDKTPTCWLWLAPLGGKGYAQFDVTVRGRRILFYGHRYALAASGVPLLDGMVVDHICRVRHCVNPEHLRQITNKENVLVGIGLSAVNARKTRCKRGHDLTDERVFRMTSTGQRICRPCHAELERQYRADRKRGIR